MARGKKTGGRCIQKGQVLNPRGAPSIKKDVLEIRQMAYGETVKTIWKHWGSTEAQLKAIMKDPTTTAGEMLLCSIIMRAITKQDILRANFLLDRLIGKVKVDIEISQPQNEAPIINFGVEKKKKQTDTVIDV